MLEWWVGWDWGQSEVMVPDDVLRGSLLDAVRRLLGSACKHESSAHLHNQMLDVPAGDINTVSLMKEKTMQELTGRS